MQEGLEAPPEEEQVGDADLLLGDSEDLSFASMFNSMRLEESDEPQQVAQAKAPSARAELDPVIPYGSFGQVLLCICNSPATEFEFGSIIQILQQLRPQL